MTTSSTAGGWRLEAGKSRSSTADTRPPLTSSTRMNQSEVRGGDQGPMKGKGRQGGRGREQATQQQALGGDGRCGKFEVRHADSSDRGSGG